MNWQFDVYIDEDNQVSLTDFYYCAHGIPGPTGTLKYFVDLHDKRSGDLKHRVEVSHPVALAIWKNGDWANQVFPPSFGKSGTIFPKGMPQSIKANFLK